MIAKLLNPPRNLDLPPKHFKNGDACDNADSDSGDSCDNGDDNRGGAKRNSRNYIATGRD